MINWEKARSGVSVVRIGGLQTSSFHDPLTEAKTWVEKMRPLVASHWHTFVLGLGSGHHVLALAQVLPANQITVLSLVPGLSEMTQSLHGDHWPKVAVIEGHRVGDIIEDRMLQQRLNQPYSVFQFIPASMHDRSGYADLAEFLIGRSPALFSSLAKYQVPWARILRLLPLDSEAKSYSLNIKHLVETARKSEFNTDCTEAFLALLALREMVK